MNQSSEIKIIIIVAATAAIIFFCFKFNSCNQIKLEDNHNDKIELQRDSLLNVLSVTNLKLIGIVIRKSDSALIYSRGYHVADSINKRYWKNKINQIPKYTPAQRSRVYDSIFGQSY